MKNKDKKLRNITNHSNVITKQIVANHNLSKAKEIAKINQVTDLLISIKDNNDLINKVLEAVDLFKLYKYNNTL